MAFGEVGADGGEGEVGALEAAAAAQGGVIELGRGSDDEVVARAVKAGIEIRVDDNGLGLPVHDHEHDREDLHDDASAGSKPSSYGLRHVRERLRAVYGPQARLDLEARQPSGVRSIVFLPARSVEGGPS